MIQLGTSPAEATEHLLRLADATGVSTEDLAADIVNSAAGSVAVTPAPASPGDGDVRAEARRMRRVVTAAEGYDTVGGAAATLLEGGLRPLGAESLWLWRTEAGSLRLAGHAGVSAAEAVRWQWIPPGAPAPLRQVLTEGSPSGCPRDLLRTSSCPAPAPMRPALSCPCGSRARPSERRWSSGRGRWSSTPRSAASSPISSTWRRGY